MLASAASLRIALIEHGFEADPASAAARATRELGLALSSLRHHPTVITCGPGSGSRSSTDGLDVISVRRLPEAPLRLRGFVGPLMQIPFTFAALSRGRFDIVHAFTALDVQPGLLWRRRSRTPLVFTCCDPPAREGLADARGRLRVTRDAFEAPDLVTAARAEVSDAAERWLAVDLPVVAPAEASAYARIYRRCLGPGVPRPHGALGAVQT
jgi:hypothetical protein